MPHEGITNVTLNPHSRGLTSFQVRYEEVTSFYKATALKAISPILRNTGEMGDMYYMPFIVA